MERWILYPSLFFKRHRDEYYRQLRAVRVVGNWQGWTDIFLGGVATIAEDAVASARDLFASSVATRAVAQKSLRTGMQ